MATVDKYPTHCSSVTGGTPLTTLKWDWNDVWAGGGCIDAPVFIAAGGMSDPYGVILEYVPIKERIIW